MLLTVLLVEFFSCSGLWQFLPWQTTKQDASDATNEHIKNCNTPHQETISTNRILKRNICSKIRIGKHLSDSLPIQNGLNKEMLYRHCSLTFL
jgi:hypothetical protein